MNKLTIQQQIEHMKSKGILFNVISEEDARQYLLDNNYYFRLKAYAKNFDKYPAGEHKNQYVKLEFAYLKEMAIIDMQLRFVLLSMAIDIEHYIKKQLINDVVQEKNEDGCNLVKKTFTDDQIFEICEKKKEKSVCRDLIIKHEEEDWTVWSLVEILSFANTIRLYNNFYRLYPKPQKMNISNLLYSVKSLRNATAHNNCILNSIKKSYTSTKQILNIGLFNDIIKAGFIDANYDRKHIDGEFHVTCERLKKRMKNLVINDFIATIVAYKRIVSSEELKKYRFGELKDFFDGRMLKHKNFFEKNTSLVTTYKILKKFIDFSLENDI